MEGTSNEAYFLIFVKSIYYFLVFILFFIKKYVIERKEKKYFKILKESNKGSNQTAPKILYLHWSCSFML